MRLLPFCGFLLLAGCSSSQPAVAPQSPPEPQMKVLETSDEVNAEINRQCPEGSGLNKITEAVFNVMEKTTNDRQIEAVRTWAGMNLQAGQTVTNNKTDRDIAYANTCKWIIAATDAKKANLLNSSVSMDYETAKKNALEEAARADSLPIQ